MGFFGARPWFWQGFAPKCSQNLEGSPKNKSCGAKTLEDPKKRKQSFGALGSLAAQDSKTLFFFVFLRPSSVLAPKFFFGTLHGFGKVLLQNASKTLRGPKKPKFWCQNAGGCQKNQKEQSFGALGSLAAQDSKTLFFSFLGTLHGFGKALHQNAPKTYA